MGSTNSKARVQDDINLHKRNYHYFVHNNSQLQLENVNPLLIYMFQDLSNDILEAQFGPPYYMHIYPKVSRFPLDYNFQNVCHLGLLWTPFFAFSHTCDNVLEFWSKNNNENSLSTSMGHNFKKFTYERFININKKGKNLSHMPLGSKLVEEPTQKLKIK